MSDIVAKVQAVVSDKLGKEISEITPEKKFVEDLGADSLDLTELVMALEEEFDIDEIADEDTEKFITVQNVIDYVSAL